MSTHHTNAKERGAAHLVLVLAFVVGLVGVLGFLGYNAWQKQNASAGEADAVGRAATGVLKCRLVSISPTPAVGVESKYRVRLTTTNMKATISLDLAPGHTNAEHTVFTWGKEARKDVVVDNETRTVTYKFTPRKSFTSVWDSEFGPVGTRLKTNVVSRGLHWSTFKANYTQDLGDCGGQNFL